MRSNRGGLLCKFSLNATKKPQFVFTLATHPLARYLNNVTYSESVCVWDEWRKILVSTLSSSYFNAFQKPQSRLGGLLKAVSPILFTNSMAKTQKDDSTSGPWITSPQAEP